MAEEELDLNVKKEKSPLKMILVILGVVLVMIAASAGTAWFVLDRVGGTTGGEEASSEERIIQPAVYFAFDPPFVVNFREKSRARFLQVTLEVMTRDPAIVELVTLHMPVIRNNLVLLFSNQTYAGLSSLEGKENLRTEAHRVIQDILSEEGVEIDEEGHGGVEAVYFTGFVMQ